MNTASAVGLFSRCVAVVAMVVVIVGIEVVVVVDVVDVRVGVRVGVVGVIVVVVDGGSGGVVVVNARGQYTREKTTNTREWQSVKAGGVGIGITRG